MSLTTASIVGVSVIALVVPVLSQRIGPPPPPTPHREQMREYLASVRRQLAGRENERAGAVFKNLRVLQDAPADRIPLIMETGFSLALGVECTHCHVPGEWEKDDKPPKLIARQMWTFMIDATERLKVIKSDAVISCTTCHRGERKPALMLR